MTRILVAGDFHGPAGLSLADKLAQGRGCDEIFQVGDFYAYRQETTTPCSFIAGNHEQWRHIRSKKFVSNIAYVPDYSVLTYDDVTVGAIGHIQDSVAHRDLMSRGWYLGQGNYYQGKDQLWLEEDWKAVEAMGRLDVLITHDMPHVELEEEDFLTRVIRQTKPSLVLHGHMHKRIVATLTLDDGKEVTILGLEPLDPKHFPNSNGAYVLDTYKRTLWHPEHEELTF